jgi:hypothetical protein
MPANAPFNLRLEHARRLAGLALRSTSPTHTIGMMPCLSAVCSFLFTISSVSAKYCRRSRVADERMRSAHGHQLQDRGLAGVGALLGKVDVLRAHGHIRPLACRRSRLAAGPEKGTARSRRACGRQPAAKKHRQTPWLRQASCTSSNWQQSELYETFLDFLKSILGDRVRCAG